MLNFKHYARIIFHNKWFYIAATACAVLMGALTIWNNRCWLNDIELKIYPAKMEAGTGNGEINPCYKTMRVIRSEGFVRQLISIVDEIDDKNYQHRVNIYETPDHMICMHLYVKDTLQGKYALSEMLKYIDSTYSGYTTSKVEQMSAMHEAQVNDYKLDTGDSIMVYDVIDAPHIEQAAGMGRWIRAIIMSFLLSIVGVGGIVLIANGMKEAQ